MLKFKAPYQFILILLLLGTQKLVAQDMRFEQLGVDHGLPSSEVYNLFQDKQGYVWAFTKSGIVKHNGVRFVPVCQNLSAEESVVYTVREDQYGNMYIANSKAKIYAIKNDSAYLIKGLEKISKKILADRGDIYDLLVIDPENIYFSTFFSTYLFTQGKVKLVTGYVNNHNILSSFIKWKNQIGVIKTYALPNKKRPTLLDLNTNQTYVLPIGINRTYWARNSMKQDQDGAYYILQDYELIRMKGKEELRVKLLANPIGFDISPDGKIWIGTHQGVYKYDHNLRPIGSSFKNNLITDILFDDNKGVWLSTVEQGVFYCKNIDHSYYDHAIFNGKVSVLKEVNKQLFLGTTNGTLYVKKEDDWESIFEDKNLAAVTDVIWFNNNYFIGTKSRVVVMDAKFNSLPFGDLFNDGKVPLNSYGFTKYGDELITSISASSVQTKSKKLVKTNNLNILPTKTRCLIQRNQKELLIGTLAGLYVFKNDSSYIPDILKPIKDKEISNLTEDHKNNIWIGTKGHGLYVLGVGNQLVKFNNCPANVVNDLIFIDDSLVFLCTNKGAFVNTIAHMWHKKWQRLIDNEVIKGAVFKNKLFLATELGLLILPVYNKFTKPINRFYLSSVIASERSVDLSDIRLSHKENSVRFNFDDLTYDRKTREYSYILVGPSLDQGVFSGVQLYLQNLLPGYYQLKIRANNTEDKEWGDLTVISFYIQPAFWQTTAFYISIVILMGFIVVMIFRLANKAERKKTTVMQKLASYKMTAIKAQINPHFVSNSLTSIQQLIMSKDIDKANLYLAKFSLLLRYVLQHADKYLTPIAEEIKIVDIIVELEQLRFKNGFVYEKKIDPNINLNKVFVPPLLIQPIIENAIWHGLLPLKGSHAPTLILNIIQENDALVISIVDNGVGRNGKNNYTRLFESKGIKLIQNWIENLNTFFPNKDAQIRFIDLKDSEGNAMGTKVDIVFPMAALYELQLNKNDTG